MTRAFAFFIIILMVMHLMSPFQLRGLRKREDVWKLALAALGAVALVALTKGG